MAKIIPSTVLDPNFLGFFKFNKTRFGIFYKFEDGNGDEFHVHEMFLKTRVFNEAVEKSDKEIAGFVNFIKSSAHNIIILIFLLINI